MLKPAEVVALLLRHGFYKVSQKGSHLKLKHPDGRMVIVPMHSKELKRGTLGSILRQAKIERP